MSARVPAKCLCRTFKGTLTCHKIIRVNDGCIPPAKEVVSRIVITRKKFFVFGWV
jgi:hypothetical protein